MTLTRLGAVGCDICDVVAMLAMPRIQHGLKTLAQDYGRGNTAITVERVVETATG